MTAALWLFTPAYPMRVSTELGDAEAWLLTGARQTTTAVRLRRAIADFAEGGL